MLNAAVMHCRRSDCKTGFHISRTDLKSYQKLTIMLALHLRESETWTELPSTCKDNNNKNLRTCRHLSTLLSAAAVTKTSQETSETLASKKGQIRCLPLRAVGPEEDKALETSQSVYEI